MGPCAQIRRIGRKGLPDYAPLEERFHCLWACYTYALPEASHVQIEVLDDACTRYPERRSIGSLVYFSLATTPLTPDQDPLVYAQGLPAKK